MWAERRALWALGLLLSATPATADTELSVAVVKPGAGFLVTDARQKVALELIVSDAKGPVELGKVEVKANQGKISGAEVIGPGRILCYYAPPEKSRSASDIIDLRMMRRGGGELQFAAPIELVPSENLKLSGEAKPQRFLAEKPEQVGIVAMAPGALQMALEPSAGQFARDAGESKTRLSGTWTPPKDLPGDAPSHLMALVTAIGPAGFGAKSIGVSALADMRVSIEIPPGNQLVLEGSENKIAPKTAAADGRTVVEDLVRYGAPIHAYSVKGKQKKEIPISIPSGMIPVALAAAIPGQNIADGGTGVSIALAIPPPPFGGELIWPEIKLEGATLVETKSVPGAKDVKALVIQRPKGPRTVNVLADGIPVGTIPFLAAHGEVLDLAAAPPRKGERGAVIARVRDIFGSPADQPAPRARIDGGAEIVVTRTGLGEYRVTVPAGTPGDPGQIKTVVVELPPPKSLTGEAMEFVSARQKLALEGPPPALVSSQAEPGGSVEEAPRPPVKKGDPVLRFALTGGALGGSTFGGQLVIGADATFEARFPVLGNRLGAYAGIEAFRGSGAGSVTRGDGNTQSSSFIFAGTVFPVGASFTLIDLETFELLVRAALELRVEAGVIDVGVDRAGGASRVGVAARAFAEGAFDVGPGAITVGLGVAGIGASAGGFSSDQVHIEGSVTHVRLDLGFRFWLL
ncbi:MAG: hypothetical protein U1E65_00790 [Myxococcota bacterium]